MQRLCYNINLNWLSHYEYILKDYPDAMNVSRLVNF